VASLKKTRILILGGGFAGLHAAIHLDDTLARDPETEITLVNRDNFFLFTPMLHEVAASDLDLTNIVNPVRKLLKRINFFAGEVESINLERKSVTVSHGFDHHHHDISYGRCPRNHRRLEIRLQRSAPSQLVGLSDTGGISQGDGLCKCGKQTTLPTFTQSPRRLRV